MSEHYVELFEAMDLLVYVKNTIQLKKFITYLENKIGKKVQWVAEEIDAIDTNKYTVIDKYITGTSSGLYFESKYIPSNTHPYRCDVSHFVADKFILPRAKVIMSKLTKADNNLYHIEGFDNIVYTDILLPYEIELVYTDGPHFYRRTDSSIVVVTETEEKKYELGQVLTESEYNELVHNLTEIGNRLHSIIKDYNAGALKRSKVEIVL